MVEVVITDPGAPDSGLTTAGCALQETRTHAVLRTHRRTGSKLVAAGVVLVLTSLLLMLRADGWAQHLRDHGARTPGVVQSISRSSRYPAIAVAYYTGRPQRQRHPERDPLIVSVTGLNSRISALRPLSKDPLWVADDGRTILLATHTHGALYAAKRPTGIQQLAQWEATIHRRAKPPTADPEHWPAENGR